METFVIVRLSSLWHIALYVDGVMQYSIYGGYKRKQDAVRVAHMKNISIDSIID
jgi:hypothetical protein